MRELTGKPESWTPREQAAVVLNALYRRRVKLLRPCGLHPPDDPLNAGSTSPLVWVSEKTNAFDKTFDRPESELTEVLFALGFAEWLEQRRPRDGRDLLSNIRIALHDSDSLIDALRHSGQLKDHEDEFQRTARLEGWTVERLKHAEKFPSVLNGPQTRPGSALVPLLQCQSHASKLTSLANSLADLMTESVVADWKNNRQTSGSLTPTDASAVIAAETLGGERSPTVVDGPLEPDGFCFDGKPAWKLTPDEKKLMTFVWSKRDDPPTWIDAAFHLCPTIRVNGKPVASPDDFNNILHRLKKKLVAQNWTAWIHSTGRGATTSGKLVLREPVKLSKKPATTKRRSTEPKLSKGGSSNKRPTKKKRASNA